jgi:glycerophosphoryl diester phosphodiesterase
MLLVEQLHPKVLAFDSHDFLPEVIAVARQAGVQIYVDRLGAADNAEAWQAAIDAGADGIQTDKPRELVEFLRAKGYK